MAFSTQGPGLLDDLQFTGDSFTQDCPLTFLMFKMRNLSMITWPEPNCFTYKQSLFMFAYFEYMLKVPEKHTMCTLREICNCFVQTFIKSSNISENPDIDSNTACSICGQCTRNCISAAPFMISIQMQTSDPKFISCPQVYILKQLLAHFISSL